MNCAVTLLYAVDQLLDSSLGVAAFSVMKHRKFCNLGDICIIIINNFSRLKYLIFLNMMHIIAWNEIGRNSSMYSFSSLH